MPGNEAQRVPPASHRPSDGVVAFDGAVVAVAGGDSLVTDTPDSVTKTCVVAKWSERASFRNDAKHNLRTRVNRRPVSGKVHKKRQTLQDMARPLKRWLCRNRNNPYPTKNEKSTLAIDASMTITQVSNWFANARRRLKTTVTHPQMSWANRISLYNSFIVGNQELLSLSSDDTLWDADPGSNGAAMSDDDDHPGSDAMKSSAAAIEAPTSNDVCALPGKNDPVTFSSWREQCMAPDSRTHDVVSLDECSEPHSSEHGSYADDISGTAHKYKHTILQRYLNDARQYALSLPDDNCRNRQRNLSGSLSSHDYEELVTSARSTPTREQQTMEDGMDDYYNDASKEWPKMQTSAEEDMYWKEISAALALTNLARPRQRVATFATSHE